MAIISSGIGSGIDINSLVNQLVDAQRQPQIQRLELREARLQARLSGYGTLQGALSALQQSLTGLRTGSAFSASNIAVGDTGVLTATASSGAAAGTHSISVDELARPQRLVTDSGLEQARFTALGDVVGTGTLTFRFGTTEYDADTDSYSFSANAGSVAHTVAITDGSLTGIASAINQAGIGVQASVMFDGTHYRLALASSETGASRSMQITVDDGDGNPTDAAGLSLLAFNSAATHMQQTEAASDTVGLMIDGIAASSSGNRLVGVINGLDITLQAPGSTRVTVTPNDQTFINGVADFVDKYNAFMESVNRLSGYDAASETAGQLNGDSLVRSAETQLRRVMGALMGDSDASLRHLSQIGITSDVATGKLVLDRDRLQSAISADRTGVARLFTGTADESGAMTGGYAAELDRVVGGLLAGDGPFSTVTDGINAGIRDIARELERVEARSLAFEERMRAQFNAMDALIGQLRSTSSFLTQQLESLPTIGGSNK